MLEKKQIMQVSTFTENAIRRKGAVSLPDRPSDENMTAEDIKKALFAPALDVTNSAISEIKRVINQSNDVTGDLYNNINSTSAKIEKIEEQLQEQSNLSNDLDKRISEIENSSQSSVERAIYAQYASEDTSKGTIEERLTALGFREGTPTNFRENSNYGGSALNIFIDNNAANSIKFKRYGNRVIVDASVLKIKEGLTSSNNSMDGETGFLKGVTFADVAPEFYPKMPASSTNLSMSIIIGQLIYQKNASDSTWYYTNVKLTIERSTRDEQNTWCVIKLETADRLYANYQTVVFNYVPQTAFEIGYEAEPLS